MRRKCQSGTEDRERPIVDEGGGLPEPVLDFRQHVSHFVLVESIREAEEHHLRHSHRCRCPDHTISSAHTGAYEYSHRSRRCADRCISEARISAEWWGLKGATTYSVGIVVVGHDVIALCLVD